MICAKNKDMEIKLPGMEDKEQQYYKDLLAKIRDIRSSERMPRQKITDLLRTTNDFDNADPTGCLSEAVGAMSRLDDDGLQRMFNCLYLVAESYAHTHSQLNVQTACEYIVDNVNSIAENPDIYNFTCYGADYAEYEREDGSRYALVSMPEELRDFKGHNMVLKIMDMDRFIDTFSSRNTYYRRAYSILNELDQHVLESLECNEFEPWEMIEYKDGGDAMFEFSHFEVNTNEPDNQYRTLYVVYRYDTTVS